MLKLFERKDIPWSNRHRFYKLNRYAELILLEERGSITWENRSVAIWHLIKGARIIVDKFRFGSFVLSKIKSFALSLESSYARTSCGTMKIVILVSYKMWQYKIKIAFVWRAPFLEKICCNALCVLTAAYMRLQILRNKTCHVNYAARICRFRSLPSDLLSGCHIMANTMNFVCSCRLLGKFDSVWRIKLVQTSFKNSCRI